MNLLVIGLGSMGKRRIRCLKRLGVERIIAYDPRADRRAEAAAAYGIATFADWAEAAAAPADARALAEALAPLGNDLTDAAIGLAPMVATALTDLAGLPGCLLSRMSGSGATCFGLFATQDEANAAAKALAALRPGWWVAAAPILS
ncbi:MAG: hypothetical protein HQL40_02295 [Alphaproteobacteria bacterium]|nr:hypothetical protein [Alphaproteobacteria bacterium]